MSGSDLSDLPDLSELRVSTRPVLRTDPIKLQLRLHGAEDRTAPTWVYIDAKTLRATGPVAVKPLLGKGNVVLIFEAGLADNNRIENIAHFDFAHATGEIWKFDPETSESTLWTKEVTLVHLSTLRDGGTQSFHVKFTWPQDGSRSAGRSGYVAVTPEPPVIELVLEIPLRSA